MEVAEQLETLNVGGTEECSVDVVQPGPGPGSDGKQSQELELLPAVTPSAADAAAAPPQGESSAILSISSSDSDSDTDSSSSSVTSSSSCSPSIVSDGEADQQNEKDNKPYLIKTKDELMLEELPPVEELTITLPEDVELKPLGIVSSIVEQLVIIESLKGLPPVNEESIIFKEDRHAAGKIFEIFGPVLHPFYVLRFNSPGQIEAKGIKIQDTVYFSPSVEDFTQYIFTENLKQDKGSDASWMNDQEPPTEALDFSEDEKESEANPKKKKTQNQRRKKRRSELNESSK
uniref:H/ACA ribonucleoprotein complex subunit n=1 Tax=Sphenodon punctatus TaxID=8508 RepID=A0A8D0GHN5_SPHPU